MAKRKTTTTTADDKPPSKSDDQKLLERMRKCYKLGTEADQDNRRAAISDLKFTFVPGEGWDKQIKLERGDDRPCYEFNRLRITVKRIVNEMRANRPQGKVRAVEDNDVDTAEVFEGLCRNIWNVSDADTVIDYAGEYQVAGGMGAWRVNTRYSSDTVFEQDIVIEPIKNPLTLYSDPTAADPIKRDAEWWFLTERIGNHSYDTRWPEKKRVSWEGTEYDDDEDWSDDETTRICEYWWKEPAQKSLYLLKNGKTVDGDKFDGAASDILKKRVIKCHKIMMCIASGDAILEKPTEWPGVHFPFVVVYGDWIVIDGKVYWNGITRHSKSAQMIHNYSFTAAFESVSLAPQAKFWATPAQAEGHMTSWSEAHKKLIPMMLYNVDQKAPGPPQAMAGPQIPAALMQAMAVSADEIKATSGIFDNSLGDQGNETSGRAITARQRQGEVATFNFPDNMGKGVRRTWEILIDLAPKVYDTERSVRILGVDGAEKYVKINSPKMNPATGEVEIENDLTAGKFDVVVTVGPSFSTQRQEATETYTQLGQAVPQVWGVAGDLIMKSMDLPYADQIAERMKALLPPQIQQQIAQAEGGKPMPPEVMQAMQQAKEAMAMVQQHAQLVQAAQAELQQEKADTDKAKSELDTKIANLKTEEARFEAQVAKAMAQIAMKEAQVATAGAQDDQASDRAALSNEVTGAVAEIQQMAGQFMQQAAQTLAEIMAKQQPTVIVHQPQRPRVTRVDRVNGSMVPVYEDQQQQVQPDAVQ